MNTPRVIATYLPQFHRVKENDEWWGKGFTDWTAVKNASPLYEGHNQPRIPLNENYYNLLDKSVMQWQANLAKNYLVDGFCFWHYWFENGRKILETPAENLLKWQDVDMPFCFCWANETWARTWSNVYRSNHWSLKFEPQKMDDNEGILLRQDYGNRKLWKKHFYYLLPFFKDKRYIKHNGMPVFIIFRPLLMPCSVQMIECWNNLANNNGFSGIYFIGWGMSKTKFPYSANIIDVFQISCEDSTKTVRGKRPKIFRNYKNLYETFFNMPISRVKTELLCGLVGYDNTPRNGENGSVIYGGNPKLFKYYFDRLLKSSIDNYNPFVFIHAWNEWAEGNYLEPDTINGYQYLDAIKYVKKSIQRYSPHLSRQ